MNTEPTSEVVDLLAALQRSVDAAKAERAKCVKATGSLRCMCNTFGCGCRLTVPSTHFHDDGVRYLGVICEQNSQGGDGDE